MKHVVKIQSSEYEVWAQWIEGELWFHLNGETRVYQAENLKTKSSKKSGLNIVSPMPGKVTKVHGAVGDFVKPGQVVMVMEAMKMEYSLKAEQNCQITKVSAQAGDQVKLGQVLVQMKALENAK